MKAFTNTAEEVGKINSEEYISDFIEQYQNLVFSICYKMTQDYFASQDLAQVIIGIVIIAIGVAMIKGKKQELLEDKDGE